MSVWTVYLLTTLEGLENFFRFVSIVTAMAAAICFFITLNEGGEALLPWVKKALLVAFACGFLTAVLPSKKDLALIFGVSWALNSEQASKLPEKVLKVVNVYMDSFLDDLELESMQKKTK